MVMANNARDFYVTIHVREDSLSDSRVLLHDPALFKSKRSGFLKKTCRQPDLADVMN
jgi:hypothetical protein